MIFTEEDLEIEEWKDLIGYDYNYQISNMGRFKILTAFHKSKIGSITTGFFDVKGYLRVSVKMNGRSLTKKVHRLVAEYFDEDFLENLTVNHKDFDKTNNKKTNLEMMSSAENAIDFITKIKKFQTYSQVIGVCYHKQINKWVARINLNGSRKSIGVFNTKTEAEEAIKNFENYSIKEGKGVSNKNKRKYSKEDLNNIKSCIEDIGFTKTRILFSIGTSTLKLIENDKYFDERN